MAREPVTQFVARALGLADFPPPEPKRGPRYGASRECWLCGGETDGIGWPQSVAIAPTFTNHNQARAPQSDAVCQSCAALTRPESWQSVIAARAMPVKTWVQAGWHSYSHFVQGDGAYECPKPGRVREILLSPPDGEWLLAINPSGQKHTKFKGQVSRDGEAWCVQFDENRIYATTDDFTACIAVFEAVTALGFAKDDALSGRYNPTATMRAGVSKWRAAEAGLKPWREARPDLMELVHFCALSATAQGFDYSKPARPSQAPTPSNPNLGQMSLL